MTDDSTDTDLALPPTPLPQEEQRHLTLEQERVRVISHAVGDRFAARVERVETGEVVGRARGATRDEAEGTALASASVKIGLSAARSSLRRGMEQLAGAAAEPGGDE